MSLELPPQEQEKQWGSGGEPSLPPRAELEALVSALEEDIGSGDVTTDAIVPADARAKGLITQKAAGLGLRAADGRADIPGARSGGAASSGSCAEGYWRGGRRAGARDRGHGAGAADGRAHGAELPRAPLGRGHVRGAGGQRDGAAPGRRCSTRARRRRGCARWRRRRSRPAAGATTGSGCMTRS